MQNITYKYLWKTFLIRYRFKQTGWAGWRLFDTKQYIFFKDAIKFYYEGTSQNPKIYFLLKDLLK